MLASPLASHSPSRFAACSVSLTRICVVCLRRRPLQSQRRAAEVVARLPKFPQDRSPTRIVDSARLTGPTASSKVCIPPTADKGVGGWAVWSVHRVHKGGHALRA